MAGKNGRGESLFWADQIAKEIVTRKKFRFTDERVPKLKKYVVKSAASVSGVLHVGRLSDTIRCDSVFKALLDTGYDAEFIWTADNVDPLRKIPEGVPSSYRQYIGMPVTDIPDPWGCHKSYEEHHKAAYLEVVFKFIHGKMKTYSMREEYLRGTFSNEVSLILKNTKLLVDIQNKYRPPDRRLSPDWSPWQPICKQCGKIITPRVTNVRRDGKVEYVCKDYQFRTEKAEGCGYEGVDDPAKGNGKLMYKGELAAQWAHWKVATEGFGKEYQVPGSALWINGEVTERLFHFPMAVPILYEHIMIGGEKMSASLGNVVYPKDWLECAPPELLRFFYNKKLMKTRSFSWSDLPKLYDDYDMHESVFFGKTKVENKKEEEHMKRLYKISQKRMPRSMPAQIPFDFAVTIAQIVPDSDLPVRGMEILKSTGHVKGKLSESEKEAIMGRLRLAKNWAEQYAPAKYRFKVQDKVKAKIGPNVKKVVHALGAELAKRKWEEEDLLNLFYALCKEKGVSPKLFFRSMYNIMISKDYGPRLAPFILSIGRKKVAQLLEQA